MFKQIIANNRAGGWRKLKRESRFADPALCKACGIDPYPWQPVWLEPRHRSS